MRHGSLLISILALLMTICYSSGCSRPDTGNPLQDLLMNSQEPAIKKVMADLAQYELQIHYTQIDRKGNEIVFTDYVFQESDSSYFYPASTVKFPIAVLALEKISEDNKLNLNTIFYVEGDTIETTFEKEVVKVFAVSDNAANNRLFELLGQDRINQGLETKNVGEVRIAHRLSTDNADDVTTKPLVIYINDSSTVNLEPSVNNPLIHLDLQGIKKGTSFMDGDSLVKEPFDFSLKNYYPLSTQQEVLKRTIFPEKYKASEKFNLGDTERELLLKAMSLPPRSWGYDTEEYYDSYVKFFVYGDNESPMPDNIKIFNKVGYAYGTLTDCAYIQDSENDLEFLLSATILVNKDQIFNDDNYEYEETGIPFLAALGREIYAYELNRK